MSTGNRSMSANARQLTLKAGRTFYEVKYFKRRWPPTVGYYVPCAVMKVVNEIDAVSRERRQKSRERVRERRRKTNEALGITSDESQSHRTYSHRRNWGNSRRNNWDRSWRSWRRWY
jgi:hypothetical protein